MSIAAVGTLHVNAQDLRRAQILAAARSCFARAGFHGATMQQVCAEAQMSPGALYRYFPSKDAIIEAIAEEEREKAGACMAQLSGDGDIVERVTRVGMGYLRQSQIEKSGGLMVEICSESIRNTAIGSRFHAIERDVRSAFAATLRRAQAAGEIDADVDIEVAVMMLLSLCDGLLMRLQLEEDFDLERMAPYIERSLRGLFQGGPAG